MNIKILKISKDEKLELAKGDVVYIGTDIFSFGQRILTKMDWENIKKYPLPDLLLVPNEHIIELGKVKTETVKNFYLYLCKNTEIVVSLLESETDFYLVFDCENNVSETLSCPDSYWIK